jgi:hypothetical protein
MEQEEFVEEHINFRGEDNNIMVSHATLNCNDSFTLFQPDNL